MNIVNGYPRVMGTSIFNIRMLTGQIEVSVSVSVDTRTRYTLL